MSLLTLKVEKKIPSNSAELSESLLEIICADQATADSVKKNLESLFSQDQNCEIYLVDLDYEQYRKYKKLGFQANPIADFPSLPKPNHNHQEVILETEREDFSELEEELF